MASLPSLWAASQWLAAVDVPQIHGDIQSYECERIGMNSLTLFASFLSQWLLFMASSPLASVQGLSQMAMKTG